MEVIVILSGGMDSLVTLADAAKYHGNDKVLALTFDYGQRHKKEMDAAKNIAKHYGIEHVIFPLDLGAIGGSALTNMDIEVPESTEETPTEKPITYVPMRNTIFIAIAAAFAEKNGAKFIYAGFNYIDSGGYPDTSFPYVCAYNILLGEATGNKVQIEVPLINMTKEDIVRFGEQLNVPWKLSWSCYKGLEKPCRKCNACIQRAKGFREAHIKDPLIGGV